MKVMLMRPWYTKSGVLHPKGELEYRGDVADLPKSARVVEEKPASSFDELVSEAKALKAPKSTK